MSRGQKPREAEKLVGAAKEAIRFIYTDRKNLGRVIATGIPLENLPRQRWQDEVLDNLIEAVREAEDGA